MKTEVKDMGKCRVTVAVEADAADVKKTLQGVKQAFTNEAKIPGFRPGKAPWDKVARLYSAEIARETEQRIIRDLLKTIIDDTKISYCNLIDVVDFKADESTGATFSLVIDTNPTVPEIDLSKISIAKANPQVTEDQIGERIDQFRGMMASFEDGTEADAINEQSLIALSVSSDIDPETVDAKAKHWVKDDEYWAQMANDSYIPGLKDQLVGKTVGAQVSFTAEYPADFTLADLAGKKVAYDITVKSFRKQVPANDEMIAQRFGLADIDAVKAAVKDAMESEAAAAEKTRVEGELVQALVDAAPFECPESVIQLAVEDEVRAILSRAQGISKEEITAHQDELREVATKNGERNVRLRYIAEKIAKDRKISLTKEEMDGAFERIAASANKKVNEVIQLLIKNNRLDDFMTEQVTAKVMNQLIEELAK